MKKNYEKKNDETKINKNTVFEFCNDEFRNDNYDETKINKDNSNFLIIYIKSSLFSNCDQYFNHHYNYKSSFVQAELI